MLAVTILLHAQYCYKFTTWDIWSCCQDIGRFTNYSVVSTVLSVSNILMWGQSIQKLFMFSKLQLSILVQCRSVGQLSRAHDNMPGFIYFVWSTKISLWTALDIYFSQRIFIKTVRLTLFSRKVSLGPPSIAQPASRNCFALLPT